MKFLKKILILVCITCVGYGLCRLSRTDKVQEKLFSLLGEDLYLAILDKVRLVHDLMMWPIDFVRALLP